MCVLSVSPTFDADQQGSTGASFEVTASGATSAVAISGAIYGSTTLFSPPYQFKIIKGATTLALTVEGDTQGEEILIQEVCTGGNQTLMQTFLNNPDRTTAAIRIKGI